MPFPEIVWRLKWRLEVRHYAAQIEVSGLDSTRYSEASLASEGTVESFLAYASGRSVSGIIRTISQEQAIAQHTLTQVRL